MCHHVSSFAKICKDQRTWRTSLKNGIYWIHFIFLNLLFRALFSFRFSLFPTDCLEQTIKNCRLTSIKRSSLIENDRGHLFLRRHWVTSLTLGTAILLTRQYHRSVNICSWWVWLGMIRNVSSFKTRWGKTTRYFHFFMDTSCHHFNFLIITLRYVKHSNLF